MGSCQEPTTQGTSSYRELQVQFTCNDVCVGVCTTLFSPEYAHPKPHLTKTLPFVGIGITSIEPEGLRKESCVAVSH